MSLWKYPFFIVAVLIFVIFWFGMYLAGSLYYLFNFRDWEKNPMTREEWKGWKF